MPQLDDPMDWDTLAAYFAGECTPERAGEVEAWIAASPARTAEVQALRGAWEMAGAPRTGSADVEAAWERMAARLRVHAATPRLRLEVALPGSGRGARLNRVAAVLLVAGAAGLVWSGLVRVPGSAPDPVSRPVQTYSSHRGERATYQLLDGSRVSLGPESRLEVPPTFGRDGARELTLTGQGYFEVTHDSTAPFLVHAQGTVTRVLGTEFAVQAYDSASGVEVLVRSGQVAVRAAAAPEGSGPVLASGERARVGPAGIEVSRGIDLNAALAWTRGELSFKLMPLERMIPELERWYDVNVRVADDALRGQRLTIGFARESAEDAFGNLAVLLDATATWRDRTVTLTRRP